MQKKLISIILTIALLLSFSLPATTTQRSHDHTILDALEVLMYLAGLTAFTPQEYAVYAAYYPPRDRITIEDALYVLIVLAAMSECECAPSQTTETSAPTGGESTDSPRTIPPDATDPPGIAVQGARVQLMAREAVDWRTRPPEIDNGDGPFRGTAFTITGDGIYSTSIKTGNYSSLVGFGLYSAGTVFDPWETARANAVRPDFPWANAVVTFTSITANGGSIVLGASEDQHSLVNEWIEGFVHIPLWNGWWEGDCRLTGVENVATGTATSFSLPDGVRIESLEVTFTVTGTGIGAPGAETTTPRVTTAPTTTTPRVTTPPPTTEPPMTTTPRTPAPNEPIPTDIPPPLVVEPVFDDCINCGNHGIICQAENHDGEKSCGFCVTCDWEIHGIIHCTGCLWGTDCLAENGVSWCGVCFVCENCCDCGNPVRPGWGLNPLTGCISCRQSSYGCISCNWCVDCNWDYGIIICRGCKRSGGCLSAAKIAWCRRCNNCFECCSC
jgi:hypothetical protein